MSTIGSGGRHDDLIVEHLQDRHRGLRLAFTPAERATDRGVECRAAPITGWAEPPDDLPDASVIAEAVTTAMRCTGERALANASAMVWRWRALRRSACGSTSMIVMGSIQGVASASSRRNIVTNSPTASSVAGPRGLSAPM